MSPPVIANVAPGVAPVVELGIGDRYDASAIAAIWDSARWSTTGPDNEWGGREPLWNDITCDVLDISTFCGRDMSLDPFEVGTASIVVRNGNGWADYKPAGAYDALLTVRPGRQIRVGVQVAAAAVVWLWRGVLDTTEPGYQPDEGDVVTLGAIDAKGDAGRAEMPRTLAPVGDGEAAYWRFHRTLDNVRWPKWRRAHDVDSVRLGATEFGSQVADELDRTAESASGHVYGDTAGKVHYRRKDWLIWPTGAAPGATIGNIGGGDVCPSGWEIRFSRDDITSRVIAGRDGQTPLVMDNDEAIGLYGLETWERTDLLPVDDFELVRIASRVLTTRSPDVMPRIAAVTLDAATGAGEVATLLANCSPLTPTRLRCRHRAGDGRTVFDRTMLVTGIEHTISPVDGWTARLSLDDATPFEQVGNPARWSDAASKWSDDDEWANIL